MKRHILFWLLFVVCFFSSSTWALNWWPIPGVDSSDDIGGVYMDYRSTTPSRWHSGIDIVRNDGTEVFSVSDGYIRRVYKNPKEPWNNAIYVSDELNGDLCWMYVHTRDFNRVEGDPNTPWHKEEAFWYLP